MNSSDILKDISVKSEKQFPKPWFATVFTLFPEIFPGILSHSIASKANQKNIWQLDVVNIRDYATDKHKTVDDTVYGGGSGMLLKPDVLNNAMLSNNKANTQWIYVSPKGERLNQNHIKNWTNGNIDGLNILCARYEGVDERLLQHWKKTHNLIEISLGDYILSGGELAAFVIIDACIRLLPDVLIKDDAKDVESFSLDLLEFPHYTKPKIWNDLVVPDVLLSGDHSKIAAWRKNQAEMLTKARRPDLWEKYINSQKK